MDPADQRRVMRHPLKLPATVKKRPSNEQAVAVETKDVSAGGVYFEFASPIDVGNHLEMVLTLPCEITRGNAMLVRCIGSVVRIDKAPSEKAEVGVAASFRVYEFL
jgi:hypothetical protein